MASSTLTATPRLQKREDSLTFALTTLFTPPPSLCDPSRLTVDGGDPFNDRVTMGNGTMTAVQLGDVSCHPPQWFQPEGTVLFYSPGMCPSGFGVVEQGSVVDGGTTTYATCCPTDAAWTRTAPEWCAYTVPTATMINVTNVTPTTVWDNTFTVFVVAVTIGWQASDLPNFDPPSAPILAQVSATASVPTTDGIVATTGPTATSRETPTASATGNEDNSDGLSTGAKAGIGIGAALAALLAIALIVFFFLRRSRKKKRQNPSNQPYGAHSSGQQQGYGSGQGYHSAQGHQDDFYNPAAEQRKSEVHGQSAPAHLDGQPVSELHSDSTFIPGRR